MKRVFIITIFVLMIFTSSSFAFLRTKGALDINRGEFYFSGIDLLVWSRYDSKFEGYENVVYKYNLKKNKKEIFYSGKCLLGDISISPNNNHIGVICVSKEKHRMLIIFNLRGEKILELPEFVQEYVWHPDRNKIIFITGYKKEVYETELTSTGVWIYDLTEKTKTKIAEKGWNVRNVSFDKHIYFWDGKKTVRFNIDSKKIEKTAIKEKVDYSPNGRYYVYYKNGEAPLAWEAPYWSPFRIFDMKKNKDLPPEKIGFLSERNPTSIVWGKDSRKIAFSGYVKRTIYERRIYIYDLESNQVIKQFKGRIVGYNKDRTVLVIYRDGKFFLEKIPVAKRFR